MEEEFFYFLDKKYLKTIGFDVKSFDGTYGIAESQSPKGYIVINWNEKGHGVTYSGKKLSDNCSVCIKKDGGTRKVFDGYIFDRRQLELILELTD